MNFNILFKEETEKDISEAYNYYESKQQHLGDKFLNELEKHFAILEKDPYIFQIRKAGRRYCPLKRFPYIIVYEIEYENIIVYAIFNTYQHTSRLDKRK